MRARSSSLQSGSGASDLRKACRIPPPEGAAAALLVPFVGTNYYSQTPSTDGVSTLLMQALRNAGADLEDRLEGIVAEAAE